MSGTMESSALQAIIYTPGCLRILDQRRLPFETVYENIDSVQDAWKAIRDMQVRGAPAIAIVAALGLAVDVMQRQESFSKPGEVVDYVTQQLEYLRTSRPTAVNLFQMADRLEELVKQAHTAQGYSVEKLVGLVAETANDMLAKDIADNKAIGSYGRDAILERAAPGEAVTVLTHCNTGSLATAGYGTALGIVRSLHATKRLAHVFCTETRPYNQGARLTAYELVTEKIPATLITDSMAALVMEQKSVSAVVVGADRVAANGDTANKIGTYQLAIVANHLNIPFYVAAPTTSIDCGLSTGREIKIEERPAEELTSINNIPLAAPGIGVFNPSFDITPASLITGIVTEQGLAVKAPSASAFDMKDFLAKTSRA